MCGIAGFTHRNRAPGEDVAKRLARALFHRGPDQQGIFESRQVSLCAVRLKIIDLEGGDQPLLSDDGDTAVIFNGEIYNHAELRRELEASGHCFHTHCDTEVVLRAFLEWDEECFSRLRGMFAVALWTESQKRLVLARDRIGIKPLYICRHGENLYFGSELKAIFEHRDIPRTLDLTALQDYLSLNYVPGPRTLAAGIEKLPPGHLLEWRDGQTRIRTWWRVNFRARRNRSLGDATAELDALLRSAVREHLQADVPLGIWASGGIDSSTILHYAAETGARLKTFSISFQGRSFDESRYFRELARAYGTEHREFDLSPSSDIQNAVEDFAYYSDEPGADAGALPVWYLARMSREDVTVALSGEGADELFGGYPTYLADGMARQARWIPRSLRRLALATCQRYLPVSDDKISFEYKLKRGIEGSALPPDEAHLFWNGTFSSSQVRELCPWVNGQRLSRHFDKLPDPREIGYLNRYLMADQRYYLPDDILYKVDRMSMAHALEVRPPFLDHRIVEFAASLPESLKIQGLRQKVLLKALMHGKLPDRITQRRKTGFDIPAHDWFRGVLRGFLMDTVNEEAVEASGIFDSDAVRSLIRDHMERRINAGYHLWGLLTLFLWIKRWRIETPVPQVTGQFDGRQLLATR